MYFHAKHPLLRPMPPRIRLRVGKIGHRVPRKLPAQSLPLVRAAVHLILGTAASAVRMLAEKQGSYCSRRFTARKNRVSQGSSWRRQRGGGIGRHLVAGRRL